MRIFGYTEKLRLKLGAFRTVLPPFENAASAATLPVSQAPLLLFFVATSAALGFGIGRAFSPSSVPSAAKLYLCLA